MMQALLKRAVSKIFLILNQQTVTSYYDKGDGVEVALKILVTAQKKTFDEWFCKCTNWRC
jgi:hypothetical protein